MLLWGTIRSRATWYKIPSVKGSYELQGAPCWQLIAVKVLRVFGSSDIMKANAESTLEATAAMVWALMFLILGFGFQLLGSLFGC